MTNPGHTEIAHGYTLADIHSMARLAVHTAWGCASVDWFERYELAYSAIAEALCSPTVSDRDLVRIGRVAIQSDIASTRSAHGYYKHKTIGAEAGPGSSPAFWKYWGDLGSRFGSPEDSVVERIALKQIFSQLSPREQQALVALAASENYRDAARLMGVEQPTFRSLIRRGRLKFYALWHEGETASKPWRPDRRVQRYS